MNKQIKYFSLMMALVFCCAISTFAQRTTGVIQGVVKDPAGAVVPNVSVTVTSSGANTSGYNRTVQSNADGFYLVNQVPPGIYTVTAASTAGFSQKALTNVNVTIENTTLVDIALEAGTGSVTVDVTTADTGATLDPTGSKVQTTIDTRQLDTLPRGVSFSSLLKTSPATRPEPLSGQFQIDGASGSENTFIIDGQAVENFRTGVLNQNNNLPTDIVSQVQIKVSGFEAEFGGATGGVVNLVTRGGNNEFHGRFSQQIETAKLNAGYRPVLNRFTLAPRENIEYINYDRDAFVNVFPGAQVSGPIIKDRLWFLANYSPQIYDTRRNVRIVSADPVGRTTLSNTEYESKVTNNYGFLRLDGDVASNLRVTGTYTWNPIVQRGVIPQNPTTLGGAPPSANFGGSLGTLTGPALTNRQGGRQNANNVTAAAIYTPNSNLIFSARFSRGFLNEKLNSYFIPQVPRVLCQAVQASAAATAGCATGFQNVTSNSQVNRDISIRTNFEGDAGFGVNLLGRHDFKFGYQNAKITNDVDRGYAALGIFQLYYGPSYTDPNVLVPPSTIPASALNPAAIGSGTLTRIGTVGLASNRNQALYAQDKWQVLRNLTINVGVRAEKEDLPSYNGSAPPINFNFGDKIAPRFGFAYDLLGDGKNKIFGSYGQFYDRLKFELPRGSFGGDFYRVDYFQILPGESFSSFNNARIVGGYSDAPGGTCPITTATTRTRCQIDYRIASNVSGASIFSGLVDPDLKPFQQNEVTVGYQRDFYTNYLFSARYTNKRVINAVEDAGFPTAGGSEAYIIGNPGIGLHAATAAQFGYVKTTTPKRRYDGLELQIDRRFANNYYFNVNYTYSRLYGNYSGLASSDEAGRTSPGVNRFFDLPFVGFTASGASDEGRLATDRPHTFNAYGGYSYDWGSSRVNETTISAFQSFWSGTPVTTAATFYGIPIPLYGRGDLGRTPKFTQTDLNLSHSYKFGRDNKYSLIGEFNVINALNEANILGYYTTITAAGLTNANISGSPATEQAAINRLLTTGIVSDVQAFLNSNQANGLPRRDGRYNLPNSYQTGRQIRFGFRFLF